MTQTQTHTLTELFDELFQIPPRPRSRWHRGGLGPRGERVFTIGGAALLVLFTVAWCWAIVTERANGEDPDGATAVTAGITAALTHGDAPDAAYLTDAAMRALTPLRGASGKLRVTVQPPGATVVPESLPPGATITYSSGGEVAESPAAPQRSGVWDVAVRIGNALRPVADFNVITMVPFSAKQHGKVGLYFLGNWPTEGGRVKRAGYVTPNGFIEVTRENRETHVSEHFQLQDFLTHDQPNVWPKYLVLSTRLVDKLELVLADLAARGIPSTGVHVMSGFRTPQYNTGGGDPRGRATLSRHMYGDASDIWIDNDGDGRMDDLNHDGKVDIRDSRVIQDAVDRVDREHPELIGGAGIYPATGSHGPFIHIDVRGYRARWIGTGDG